MALVGCLAVKNSNFQLVEHHNDNKLNKSHLYISFIYNLWIKVLIKGWITSWF